METYQISEVHDIYSIREGTIIQVTNLSSAKRAARRLQLFQGTRLVIRDHSGKNIIAYTNVLGKWDSKLWF